MKKYEVENHVPSILPDGEWNLVWSDEFDGTELDKTKWEYRTHIWGKRHPGFSEDEGLYLDGNSNAVFTIFEKDGEVCSPHLQTGYNWMDAPFVANTEFSIGHGDDVENTSDNPLLVWPLGKFREHKFLHKYGYYECRCKLQERTGWWSAFWLQSPIIGTCIDEGISGVEVDIMECFHPGSVGEHMLHYGGYGESHQSKFASERKDYSLGEYHTFGVHWEPDGYTFYVDGKQDGEKVTGAVSHIPQFILISTEVLGYRQIEGCPTAEARETAKVGDKFIVDYVRVFDKVK